MIGLNLSLSLTFIPLTGAEGGQPPSSGSHSATIAEFSRDRTLFDSGFFRGENAVDIPLSGTTDAPDGAQIMCEIVRADTAEVVHPAAAIATAYGGGWAGVFPFAQRSPLWLKPRVWVSGSPAKAETVNRFGVGSVIFEEEQSNGRRGIDPAFDKAEAPSIAIADDDAVQIIHTGHETPDAPTADGFHHVTDAARYSVGVSYRAAAWISKFPGHKVLMAFDMVSGTAQQEIFDDSSTNRYWSVSKGLADLIHADGGEVGLVIDTHDNSAPLGGRQYGSYLARVWFGKELDGTAAPAKPYVMGSFTNDHDWTEAYPEVAEGRAMLAVGQNPWPFLGGSGVTMVSNALLNDGTRLRGSTADLAALGRFDLLNSVHGGQVRIMNWSSLFESGYPALNDEYDPVNGDTWTDGGHFNNYRGKDGMPGYQAWRLMSAVAAFGLTDFGNPVFDQSSWDPSGAYVDFWSSEGPVTTIAKIEGYAALDGSEPQHTEVLGFDIDGYFAHRADIVDENGNPATAGRVRVYPRDGETFGPGTVIDYKSTLNNRGHGMASTDRFDLHYRHRPLVDVGVAGMYGFHVDDLPVAELNKNNLASKSFTREGDGGFVTNTIFETEEATILLKGYQARFGEDGVGYGKIIRWENDLGRGAGIFITHNRVTLRLPKWDGFLLFDGTLTFPLDNLQGYLSANDGMLPDIRIVYGLRVDDGAGGYYSYARLFIDDTEISAANASGLGITASGNSFGTGDTGAAGNTAFDKRLFLFETDHYAIEEFSMWKEARADGALPADDSKLFCRMTADGAGGFSLAGITKV